MTQDTFKHDKCNPTLQATLWYPKARDTRFFGVGRVLGRKSYSDIYNVIDVDIIYKDQSEKSSRPAVAKPTHFSGLRRPPKFRICVGE